MKSLIVNITLTFVAVILITIIFPLGLLVQIGAAVFRPFSKTIEYFTKLFYRVAVSLDQLGNVLYSELFNLILITKNATDLFGDEDETISSVLGKNKLKGNLSFLGDLLDKILDFIDPNHSIKSIEK